MKEEALAREGVSADQVLRQARQAADGYLKGAGPGTGGWAGSPGLPVPSKGRRGPCWPPASGAPGCFIKNKKTGDHAKGRGFHGGPGLVLPFSAASIEFFHISMGGRRKT